MRLKNLLVGAILCASLLVAAPAVAQTASDGYSQPSGSIEERISTERAPDPPSATIEAAEESRAQAEETEAGGALPFTGRDLALIVAAGGVLLGMGFGMRRLSRTNVA